MGTNTIFIQTFLCILYVLRDKCDCVRSEGHSGSRVAVLASRGIS